MTFWKSARLTVELTGADLPGSLRALKDVPLENTRPAGALSLRFELRRRDLPRVEALCRKRGDALIILRRQGLYWYLRSLRHRPVLVIGMGLLLALQLIVPTRILFIRVEGNRILPSARILAAAEDCGLRFGASRRQLRSEQVKNALLGKLPQLKWAGVNTRGPVATISVREDSGTPPAETPPGAVAAVTDGVIEACTVSRGRLLCRPGDAVLKGQLLISPFTDSGRFTGAEGEILARTARTFSAVTPAYSVLRGKKTESRRHYSLIIGKNRINFGKDSGIRGGSCGRMYEEYYITLPGGFSLPIALAVDEYTRYETVTLPLPMEEAEKALSGSASRSLSRSMIAGSILNASETVTREGAVYRLRGTYLCREMIGRLRQEQIGE